MPQLARWFHHVLLPPPDGTSAVMSQERARDLARKYNERELSLLMTRAQDVLSVEAWADPAFWTTVARKLSVDRVPTPLNTLRDCSACSRWLASKAPLRRITDGRWPNMAQPLQASDVFHTLERAVMKIGAHMEGLDPQQRGRLMMLPGGADGSRGPSFVEALQTALSLVGADELRPAVDAAELPVEVGRAVDALLSVHTPHISMPPIEEWAPQPGVVRGVAAGFSAMTATEHELMRRRFLASGVSLEIARNPYDATSARAAAQDPQTRRYALEAALSDCFPNTASNRLAPLRRYMFEWVEKLGGPELYWELANSFYEAENGANFDMLFVGNLTPAHVEGLWGDGGAPLPENLLAPFARAFPAAAGKLRFVGFCASDSLHPSEAAKGLGAQQFSAFAPGGQGVAVGYRGPCPGYYAGAELHMRAAASAFSGALMTGDSHRLEWSNLRAELADIPAQSRLRGRGLDLLAMRRAHDGGYVAGFAPRGLDMDRYRVNPSSRAAETNREEARRVWLRAQREARPQLENIFHGVEDAEELSGLDPWGDSDTRALEDFFARARRAPGVAPGQQALLNAEERRARRMRFWRTAIVPNWLNLYGSGYMALRELLLNAGLPQIETVSDLLAVNEGAVSRARWGVLTAEIAAGLDAIEAAGESAGVPFGAAEHRALYESFHACLWEMRPEVLQPEADWLRAP